MCLLLEHLECEAFLAVCPVCMTFWCCHDYVVFFMILCTVSTFHNALGIMRECINPPFNQYDAGEQEVENISSFPT